MTLSFRGMHKTGSTTTATAATTNAKVHINNGLCVCACSLNILIQCQANNISIKVDTIQEYARDRHGSDYEVRTLDQSDNHCIDV